MPTRKSIRFSTTRLSRTGFYLGLSISLIISGFGCSVKPKPEIAIPTPTFAEKFANAKDNKAFVEANSINPYNLFELDASLFQHQAWSPLDSLLFESEVGIVHGPFENDSISIWLKVVEADTAYKMQAGNIYLNPQDSDLKTADSLANVVYQKFKEGVSYNELCQQYSSSHTWNTDCALDPFFQGDMVPEFENEVLKHTTGDVFRVDTEYGFHIVKVLAPSVKQRFRVSYVEVVRLKFRP